MRKLSRREAIALAGAAVGTVSLPPVLARTADAAPPRKPCGTCHWVLKGDGRQVSMCDCVHAPIDRLEVPDLTVEGCHLHWEGVPRKYWERDLNDDDVCYVRMSKEHCERYCAYYGMPGNACQDGNEWGHCNWPNAMPLGEIPEAQA